MSRQQRLILGTDIYESIPQNIGFLKLQPIPWRLWCKHITSNLFHFRACWPRTKTAAQQRTGVAAGLASWAASRLPPSTGHWWPPVLPFPPSDVWRGARPQLLTASISSSGNRTLPPTHKGQSWARKAHLWGKLSASELLVFSEYSHQLSPRTLTTFFFNF